MQGECEGISMPCEGIRVDRGKRLVMQSKNRVRADSFYAMGMIAAVVGTAKSREE